MAHSSKMQFIMVGKSQQQEGKAAGCMASPVRRQRVTDANTKLLSFDTVWALWSRLTHS